MGEEKQDFQATLSQASSIVSRYLIQTVLSIRVLVLIYWLDALENYWSYSIHSQIQFESINLVTFKSWYLHSYT